MVTDNLGRRSGPRVGHWSRPHPDDDEHYFGDRFPTGTVPTHSFEAENLSFERALVNSSGYGYPDGEWTNFQEGQLVTVTPPHFNDRNCALLRHDFVNFINRPAIIYRDILWRHIFSFEPTDSNTMQQSWCHRIRENCDTSVPHRCTDNILCPMMLYTFELHFPSTGIEYDDSITIAVPRIFIRYLSSQEIVKAAHLLFRASSWSGDTSDARVMIIKREPNSDRDDQAPYDLIKGSSGKKRRTDGDDSADAF